MSLLQRGLMFVLAAGTLALPLSTPPETRAGGRAAAPVDPQTESVYTPADKEFYLDEAQMDFIRPGLKVTIGAVTDMEPGKKPSVEVTLTDDLNQPLDRLGGTTPGVVAIRFVPAVFDPATNYTNLLLSNGQPTADRGTGGTWADLGNGKYKYTFAAALPTFDTSKPMTLFVGAVRNMDAYLGKRYYANVFKDFVPATNAAATTWAVTTTAKCNACHDPIEEHGRNYREVKACALCHNANNMAGNLAAYDTGMWHRIHASNLEDIGEITYPQAYLNNCEACHDPKATQGTVHLTKPGAAACGGCHADIDFAAGVGHPAQADDSACANCHIPDSGEEYDASIKGAHTLIYKSKQLKGLKATIVSVANVAPGQNPIVTFKLTENDGKVLDPKPFGSNVNVLVAGPTTDYPNWPNVRERVDAATFDGTNAVVTLKYKVPADFKGSLAFSMDVRRTVTLNAGTPKQRTFNECAFNEIKYVAAAGGSAVARRTIVSQTKCLACHDRLALHGGQRLNVLYCSMCHNPNADDSPYRTEGAPESIDFRRMVHRIHSGEELTQDFTIIGYHASVNNYNEVLYPGDRRNCLACHVNAASANLPVVTGALNVVTQTDYFTPQGPGTAACLGCHDTRDAAAHAYLNTAVFGEACGACHGATSEWSVATVHAR
jgi:OmcA/MtrC family decaheme c-type cytochrome